MRTRPPGLVLFLVVLVILATSAACNSKGTASNSSATRSAALQRIAVDYAHDNDLGRAESAIKDLRLANPGQLLVTQAEEAIATGHPRDEIAGLAGLAEALGARSPQLIAYLSPTRTPQASPIPAATDRPAAPVAAPAAQPAAPTAVLIQITATGAPISTEVSAEGPELASEQAPAATAEPQPTATSAPAKPRVTAPSAVNLRSGPGTAYPVIGQIQAGQTLDIMARNAAGDWWRVAYPSEEQAWVSAGIVEASGAGSVSVAKNISAPPPTAAPAPTQRPAATQPPAATRPPAAPQATKAPQAPSGVQYVVKSFRLRPVGQDSQTCNSGDHNIFVVVEDAAGNRLDGVRVHEVWSNTINVTGAQGKGQGTAQWDIYRDGGGQMEIVDGAGNRLSELSRGMSANWPDFDLMRAAGYCGCKPHPDDASCEADIRNHSYLFAYAHYVYELTFRRTY